MAYPTRGAAGGPPRCSIWSLVDSSIGVNLEKILAGPESEHPGLRYNSTHSQLKAVLGWAWKGIGLGSESDSVRLFRVGMKIVGYEKAEFSEICKWK